MHTQTTTYRELPTTNNRYEWLMQRMTGIGSSDASAIFGLSEYKSPYTLWEEKTGRVPLDPPMDDRTRELMAWGNRLEPVILQALIEDEGIEAIKPEHAFQNLERPWQHANLDGLTNDGRIIEIKTTDARNATMWRGQIPDHAEIQIHHSAAVTGYEHAIVAGLIGGNDLRVYYVDINPRIVEMLTETEAAFWECVERDTPPDVDGHKLTLEALTREWAHTPEPQEIAAEDVQDIWQQWSTAHETRLAAEAEERQAKARLAQLMDGHDTLTTGDRVWAKTRRGRLDMSRLRADHEDLVEAYKRPIHTFDSDRFRADHPDIYSTYQFTTITPTPAQ